MQLPRLATQTEALITHMGKEREKVMKDCAEIAEQLSTKMANVWEEGKEVDQRATRGGQSDIK